MPLNVSTSFARIVFLVSVVFAFLVFATPPIVYAASEFCFNYLDADGNPSGDQCYPDATSCDNAVNTQQGVCTAPHCTNVSTCSEQLLVDRYCYDFYNDAAGDWVYDICSSTLSDCENSSNTQTLFCATSPSCSNVSTCVGKGDISEWCYSFSDTDGNTVHNCADAATCGITVSALMQTCRPQCSGVTSCVEKIIIGTDPGPSAGNTHTGLVPCGNDTGIECTLCHFMTLADRILDFLIMISVAVAALLFMNAGVLYVGSAANPRNISKAHRIFFNTLIGLVLILAAWMVIDTVMKMLYDSGGAAGTAWGPWNEILCK